MPVCFYTTAIRLTTLKVAAVLPVRIVSIAAVFTTRRTKSLITATDLQHRHAFTLLLDMLLLYFTILFSICSSSHLSLLIIEVLIDNNALSALTQLARHRCRSLGNGGKSCKSPG